MTERWIDRQTGVTADERLIYDVLDNVDAIGWNLAPPYLLQIARQVITELDASRAGVIPE